VGYFVAKTRSNLPETEEEKSACRESGVGTFSWWLEVGTRAQESSLLEAAAKQQLVKTQQNENT
jgi:hypothetical protein